MNGSPSVRTRKQAAEATKQVNGDYIPVEQRNGSIGSKELVGQEQKTENIFLFYPNIIGMLIMLD